MNLNPAQRDVVETRSGPLLVLAGAGTGKTQTVTARIAALIRYGVAPQRILAVTFTNKAATEMRQRALALIAGGKKIDEAPEISTFHSLCVRVLRRHIDRLGYPRQFSIYDRGDQEGVARTVLREIRVPEATLRPGDLLYFIGRWKNSSVRPDQAIATAETDKEHLAASAYRRYQAALRAVGSVDFDDLLLLVEDLFEQFPEVRQAEANRFDHLLIDEYQDTNGSQYRIVKALASGHRNLCVVGDDDQAIYGWRGAEVTHILRFTRDWPEAKVVRLETNYRSTSEIIAWANRLIAFNKLRHDKQLRATSSGPAPRIMQFEDETAEAKGVVGEIYQRIRSRQCDPKDIAILFRTNEQPRAFETELRKANLPYVLVGGMSFFDRKEVRDVLSYFKLVANPRDEVALRRVLNCPPRGIGQSTIERLTARATADGKPLWDILVRSEALGEFPPTARRGIDEFTGLIQRHHTDAVRYSLVEVAKRLLADIRYEDELARVYPEKEDRETRWKTVEEVVNALGQYCQEHRKPNLGEFLQELMLSNGDDDRDKESKLQRNAIVLMTLHAAKGLEFPEVFLVGMEEELLPHKRSIGDNAAAIDEERRLCYVGVTRAKRVLTLSLALNRRKWGKLTATIPSRFLYEITGQATNPNYLAVLQGKRKPPRRKA